MQQYYTRWSTDYGLGGALARVGMKSGLLSMGLVIGILQNLQK